MSSADEQDGQGSHHGVNASYYALRSEALVALCVEKGIFTEEELEATGAALDARSPKDGARVVARAWVDPEFKKRLIAVPEFAIQELGYSLHETVTRLAVMENTDMVHYVAVCTLCSCYPRSILGRPPDWYKGFAYRSRVVGNPRAVMREFGFEPDKSIEVRVMDSTADLRYLILPRRPANTEHMSEEELAELVTQESMIGVTGALEPKPATVAD
tara:strand:+ start:1398 stop:2042 length:645 start_codon:yes stop_codon:yes gene_type:complete